MAATPSGKDKILRWTRLYIDEFDLSGDSRTFSSLDNSYGEINMTGWTEAVHNFICNDQRAVGVRGYQAMLDDAAGGAFAELKARDTSRLSLLFGGGGVPAYGDPAYLMRSIDMGEAMSFDAGLAILSGDFNYDAGDYDISADDPFGVVLHGADSRTSTTTGTSFDAGASTAAGGHANMHMIAVGASAVWAFKLQHSTNDSDWSDITGGGFTLTGSAVGSESIEFTGTINQFTRALLTYTSGGAVTPIITFARNIVN